jgi:hypothetical protein
MKKIVFFLLFLAFTRVGFAAGLSPSPVGIGNFFLGTPKITDSNFNQVLGLLVGPSGQPGVAGVSGANGKDGAPGSPGLNGLPGIAGINGVSGANGLNGADGRDGAPGAPGTPGVNGVNGVNGAPGPAGPAGPAGGGAFVGLGGGSVALGSCDKDVTVAVSQEFNGTFFRLKNISVSGIDSKCAGQLLKIYVPIKPDVETNFGICTKSIDGETVVIEASSSACADKLHRVNMSDLGDNIGLEINGGV